MKKNGEEERRKGKTKRKDEDEMEGKYYLADIALKSDPC